MNESLIQYYSLIHSWKNSVADFPLRTCSTRLVMFGMQMDTDYASVTDSPLRTHFIRFVANPSLRTPVVRFDIPQDSHLQEKFMSTPYGRIRFERGGIKFGGRTVVFASQHGDPGCWCQHCYTYKIVINESRNGWNPVEYITDLVDYQTNLANRNGETILEIRLVRERPS